MLLANQFTVSLASGNQVSTVKLAGGAGRLVHARGSVHSTRSARPTRTSPSPAPPHRARTRGRARQPVRANQKTASWRGKSSSMTRPSKAERCPRDQTRANRPRYRSSGRLPLRCQTDHRARGKQHRYSWCQAAATLQACSDRAVGHHRDLLCDCHGHAGCAGPGPSLSRKAGVRSMGHSRLLGRRRSCVASASGSFIRRPRAAARSPPSLTADAPADSECRSSQRRG